jgi:O-6-methylguanine DNA methyltransferase
MRENKTASAEASRLRHRLRSLGVTHAAPKTLLPRVLDRVRLGDRYWALESPVGRVFVATSPLGITRVSRAASAQAFEHAYRQTFGRTVLPAETPAPSALRRRIEGRPLRTDESLRFDLSGLTRFERAVLKKATEIPRGEVRPYGWIAREIGHPGAVRAAGSALARNPVPLLIPCHRVVRTDGHIGNYSMGGRRAKRLVLEAEGAKPEIIERLASSGVRYLGNASKRYFCYPTCGGIQTPVDENTVRFQSERDAVAAGYHPCKTCRPVALAS